MDKQELRMKEAQGAQTSLQSSNLEMESLDFSELSGLKGGKDKDKDKEDEDKGNGCGILLGICS